LNILPLEELARQKEDSFDVITLWHVLEHVHDIEGYIDHFHSILKKEGTLIIAVPNHTSRDAKHYKSNGLLMMYQDISGISARKR
jgi:2-polyprenyl-3-methyl-5-hydroxy-6-metoxy-1,4-benzoquinol methylase